MKKFRLFSSKFVNDKRQSLSVANTVEADSYAEVIQELESNAGWYTDANGAFKVAYIEEVVNETKKNCHG